MKKTIIILSLLTGLWINAQSSDLNLTNKGKFLLSGNTNLSLASVTTEYENQSFDDTTTVFDLKFDGGFFVANDFALGLSVNYQNPGKNMSEYTLLAGPFAKYYFRTKKNMMPFIQTGLLFGTNKYTLMELFSSGYYEVNTSILGIEVDLGLAIPLSKSVSFDVIVGYLYASENATYSNRTSTINTKALGLNLGLSLYLGKK